MPDVAISASAVVNAGTGYTVPDAQEILVRAVRASYDGSGAAGSFIPTLRIVSDAGLTVAECPIGPTLAAGASADVTWFPRVSGQAGTVETTNPIGDPLVNPTTELLIGDGLVLTEPTVGVARVDVGGNIASLYEARIPSGWWKLDEPSGFTAVDSSGNGFDATLNGAGASPVWAQPAGPPGTTTVLFANGQKDVKSASFPSCGHGATIPKFTAAGWVNYTDNDPSGHYDLFRQGNATTGFGTGFALSVQGSLEGNPLKAQAYIGDGTAGGQHIASDSQLTQGVWYFLAVTFDGTTWRLYVNGTLQAQTYVGNNTANTDIELGAGMDGYLSWLAIWPNVLSASDLLEIYTLSPSLLSVTGLVITGNFVSFASVPTIDPHVAGQLWSSAGVLTVSAG